MWKIFVCVRAMLCIHFGDLNVDLLIKVNYEQKHFNNPTLHY